MTKGFCNIWKKQNLISCEVSYKSIENRSLWTVASWHLRETEIKTTISILTCFIYVYKKNCSWLEKARGEYTFDKEIIKSYFMGFPGGAVVENLPASAGDTGSSPGLGRSHMPRSNWAREPQLLSLRIWRLCSATREATIVRGPCTAMKSGPRLPQLEEALAQKRRPNTAKKINK